MPRSSAEPLVHLASYETMWGTSSGRARKSISLSGNTRGVGCPSRATLNSRPSMNCSTRAGWRNVVTTMSTARASAAASCTTLVRHTPTEPSSRTGLTMRGNGRSHGSPPCARTRPAGVGMPAASRRCFTWSLRKARLRTSGGDPVKGIPSSSSSSGTALSRRASLASDSHRLNAQSGASSASRARRRARSPSTWTSWASWPSSSSAAAMPSATEPISRARLPRRVDALLHVFVVDVVEDRDALANTPAFGRAPLHAVLRGRSAWGSLGRHQGSNRPIDARARDLT